MPKYNRGLYTPKHPEKYKGTYPICWRSSWELKMLNWLDNNPNVLYYASESTIIPYYHPIKKRMARYFPDFFAIMKDNEGKITKYIIEIKPLKETVPPVKGTKKRKQTQLYEELTYAVNQAKWEAAQKYCKENGLKFQILTENQIYRFK